MGRLRAAGVSVEVAADGRARPGRCARTGCGPGAWPVGARGLHRPRTSSGSPGACAGCARPRPHQLAQGRASTAAWPPGLAGVPVVWHVRDRIAADYLPRPAVAPRAERGRPPARPPSSPTPRPPWPPSCRCRWRARRHPEPGRRPRDRAPRPSGPGTEPPVAAGRDGRPARPLEGPARVPRGVRRGVPGRWRRRGRRRRLRRCSARTTTPSSLHAAGAAGSASTDRVEFAGFRDDVAGRAGAASTCSCTPRSSPSRSARWWSRAWPPGCPWSPPDAGGPAEIITHGLDGLLYAMGDQHALARHLRTLAADPGLRTRLGAAGYDRAVDFSPESAAAKVMQVYRGVLSDRSPRPAPVRRGGRGEHRPLHLHVQAAGGAAHVPRQRAPGVRAAATR